MTKIYSLSGLAVYILCSLTACKTIDLRTPETKQNFNQEQGLQVLNKMHQAHSLDEWDNLETYSCHLTDEFFGLMGKFSNPFPKNKADFEFQAIPHTFTSRAKFRDAKWKDKIWGIQSWKTYSTDDERIIRVHDTNDKTIEFWLPTYQYFIEIPLKIFEASVISYAGARTVDGVTYDLVYATWKSAEPQKELDQYILWIDQKTHLLRQIQYTVRDQYKWVHATMEYTQYSQQERGILFPIEMKVNLYEPQKKKTLHKITISEIRFNSIPSDSLVVLPELSLDGKQ